jgi:hypothetical protein
VSIRNASFTITRVHAFARHRPSSSSVVVVAHPSSCTIHPFLVVVVV